MLSWHVRRTGIHYRPEPRLAVAAVLLVVWFVIGVFLTFGFDWQITNVYAHLGLYGHALPNHPTEGLYRMFSYPPERVARVNHWMDHYGNMVLFMPLAVLMPMIWPRVRWWQVGLAGLALSTSVELTQWFVGGRVAQVSDVVVNTSGVLAAAIVVATLRWAYRMVRGRPDHGGTHQPSPAAPMRT